MGENSQFLTALMPRPERRGLRTRIMSACLTTTLLVNAQLSWAQVSHGATAPEIMPNAELQKQALAFAQEHLEINIQEGDRFELSTGKMDPRLKLVRCDQPLSFQMQNNSARSNRLLVKARCAGSKPPAFGRSAWVVRFWRWDDQGIARNARWFVIGQRQRVERRIVVQDSADASPFNTN